MTTTPATRDFSDEPLPASVLYRILDQARFAPTAATARLGTSSLCVTSNGNDAWRSCGTSHNVKTMPFTRPAWFRSWRRRRIGATPRALPSEQPVDLDLARRTPLERATGTPPQTILTAAVLLVISVNLTRITAMDSGLGRLSISAGGSVYPFAHNILLAARDAGYGGVITTVLVRQEPAVKDLLGIPDEHALACIIPLGKPRRQVTRLRRVPVEDFTTLETFAGTSFTPG